MATTKTTTAATRNHATATATATSNHATRNRHDHATEGGEEKNLILPNGLYPRENDFLTLFAKMSFCDAIRACHTTTPELFNQRATAAFRHQYEELEQAKRIEATHRIERALQAAAERMPEDGGPDTRAAALLLPAMDARYKANAQQQAQAVQINITI